MKLQRISFFFRKPEYGMSQAIVSRWVAASANSLNTKVEIVMEWRLLERPLPLYPSVYMFDKIKEIGLRT